MKAILDIQFPNHTIQKIENDGFCQEYTNDFRIIDCLSISKFQLFIQFISNIISTRHIINLKHVFILDNIHHLPKQHQHTVCVLAEKYLNNSIFIFTSSNMSKTHDNIQNACFRVRIPIFSSNEIYPIIQSYVNKNDIYVDDLKNIISGYDDIFILLIDFPFDDPILKRNSIHFGKTCF